MCLQSFDRYAKNHVLFRSSSLLRRSAPRAPWASSQGKGRQGGLKFLEGLTSRFDNTYFCKNGLHAILPNNNLTDHPNPRAPPMIRLDYSRAACCFYQRLGVIALVRLLGTVRYQIASQLGVVPSTFPLP
jgi:hypothetical protein